MAKITLNISAGQQSLTMAVTVPNERVAELVEYAQAEYSAPVVDGETERDPTAREALQRLLNQSARGWYHNVRARRLELAQAAVDPIPEVDDDPNP